MVQETKTIEKTKEKRVHQLKDFLETNKMFVFMKAVGDEVEFLDVETLRDLISSLSLEERIALYFTNFSSIFANIRPEDQGNFIYVPTSDSEYEELEIMWMQ